MSSASDLWTQIVEKLQAVTAEALPPIVGALLLLLGGWIIALISQAIVAGLLRRIGLDRLAERIGADRTLRQIGVESPASRIVGRIVYWLLLLVFILAAVNRLGLRGVDEALSIFIGYLPNVLAAALILFLGAVLARFAGEAVGAFAIQAGISGGRILGLAVRYVLIGLTIILAMDQLNLRTTLLSAIAVMLVGAFVLAMALAFGLGSRELARNIMAGFHARESFTAGQRLAVRNHTGRLVSIDTAQAVLETDAGWVSVPNTALVEEEVLVLPEGEGAL